MAASTDLQTHCDIDAPPVAVWDRLADARRFRTWTTVIALWARRWEARRWALLILRLGRLPPVPVPVRLVRVDPGRALIWRGGLPGLLLGEHSFRLERTADGGTRLAHGERFSGLLARPALACGLRALSLAAYERLNADLKIHAEGG